jgi:pyruvate formate lyase activating enzyme
MIIGGLQKFSLIDYPGEVCAIIFTVGCNFRCPYCHNPELVIGSAKIISADYVFDFLKSRVGKLSAVSITGGEPTLHSDLIDFVEKIRLIGYKKIKLDTNGTNPHMLKKLIDDKLISYVAMDIKAPFEKYRSTVNIECDLEKIKESIELIKNSGIEYEFRTTAVEGLLEEKDIISIANYIKGAKAYHIQKFIPSKTLNESFSNKQSLSPDKLDSIKNKISSMFDIFSIR